MQITNFIVLATAFASYAAAMPAAEANPAALGLRNECGNDIGPCAKHDCRPRYPNPSAIVGVCSNGKYIDCECNKCAGKTDSCSKNGCEGVRGVCTAGEFQGCNCN